MAAASEEMPDDERVEAMRAAYESDPSPEASLYLEVGRGFEARRLFDAAIVEAVAQRAAGCGARTETAASDAAGR